MYNVWAEFSHLSLPPSEHSWTIPNNQRCLSSCVAVAGCRLRGTWFYGAYDIRVTHQELQSTLSPLIHFLTLTECELCSLKVTKRPIKTHTLLNYLCLSLTHSRLLIWGILTTVNVWKSKDKHIVGAIHGHTWKTYNFQTSDPYNT